MGAIDRSRAKEGENPTLAVRVGRAEKRVHSWKPTRKSAKTSRAQNITGSTVDKIKGEQVKLRAERVELLQQLLLRVGLVEKCGSTIAAKSRSERCLLAAGNDDGQPREKGCCSPAKEQRLQGGYPR